MGEHKKSTVSMSEGARPAWVSKGQPPVVGLRRLRSDDVFAFGRLERLTLGTDATCDVVLDDPTVSGAHCVIERERNRVTLQDSNSRNGTYLNGIRCQRVELRDGVIVSVGRTHLVAYSEGNSGRKTSRERIAGHHPSLLRAVEAADRAAFEGRNLVIVGEAGTGKTLLAHVVHEIARGPALPFVEIDCARPDAARALFGASPTALERAAGGTLYVRNPDELSAVNSGRLLESLRAHALNEPASLRLIAAAPHLTAAMQGYAVIAPVTITLSPLRDRMTDLRDLVSVFIDEFLGTQHAGLSKQTMAALRRHDWKKGNVAELREAVEWLVMLATSGSLREWASRVGKPRRTLQRWIERMNLPSSRIPGDHVW